MMKHLIAMATLAALGTSAHAAISIATPATTYAQNFDTLTVLTTSQAWANDSTLVGWSLFTGAGAAIPTYTANDGASNTGSYYSYGTIGAGERALGSAASGGAYFGSPASAAVAGYMAVALSNDTGAALASFTLGFNGEQWRNGGNTTAQSLVLSYGFGATYATVGSWTAPGGNFNFTSPVATATAAAVNGNGAGLALALGGTVTTPWLAGDTLWVRWADSNDAANDHGLAIDDLSFSVSAVPEADTAVMLLAGLASLAFIARRRRD